MLTAALVATPIYTSPFGYFILRLLASFWLYTTTLMHLILFVNPSKQSKFQTKTDMGESFELTQEPTSKNNDESSDSSIDSDSKYDNVSSDSDTEEEEFVDK